MLVNQLYGDGLPGLSAYEIAVSHGFVGTEDEWLESLRGIPGPAGADSTIPGPPGIAGINGKDGHTPVKGVDYFDGAPGAASTVPGPKGDKGDPGAASTVPGPKGDKGDTGSTGPQGPMTGQPIGFAILPNDTLTQALATNINTRVTVTTNRTLTTTVPAAGIRSTVEILTAGTSSFTVTFGTGFKPVGTLATGTTASRIFSVNFLSDGTNLHETGRTAAMVA